MEQLINARRNSPICMTMTNKMRKKKLKKFLHKNQERGCELITEREIFGHYLINLHSFASRDALSVASIYPQHLVCHTSTFSDPVPEALEIKFMMCLADTVLPAPLSPLKKTSS